MSATVEETLATIQSILNAQITLVRISTPILLVLGNIGEILNIIIFVQNIFRTNSCAIYFLAASWTRLFFINFTILLNDLSFGYNIDPARTSLVFCKIKFYLTYIAAILPPSFMILACIDRWLLSSLNARARSWSQPQIAYRSLLCVSLFWMLFSIHSLFGSTISLKSGITQCYLEPGSYTLFVALYSIIINYLLPPTLMAILGLLTIINIRQTQRRTYPMARAGYMLRKDRHLLRMLLFQVLVNIIFTIPGGAYQLHNVISTNWQKNAVQNAWELFFFVLALCLFYIPNCIAFFIYTLTASIFRQELRRITIKYYRHFFPQKRTRIIPMTTTVR